jgi:PAS domain S-box-containing protein
VHPTDDSSALRSRIAALEADNAALRSSEATFRRIVEQSDEGIWEVDVTAATVYVNPKMGELLGWAPDEMLGRSAFDFMDDDARVEARAIFARRLAGVRERHVFRFCHRDGSALWARVSAAPVLEDGVVVGVRAWIADLTEVRRQRAARHHAEALLAAAIEASPAAIIIADADGTIRVANPAARQLAGGDVVPVDPPGLAAAVTRWDLRRLDGTPLPVGELPLVRALRGERVSHAESTLRLADGSERALVGGAGPVRDADGVVVAAVLVIADVSELRDAEHERDRLREQVAAARKAESLAAMAGAIAHDFNNALMAISGEAALAHSDAAPGSLVAQALSRILVSTEVATTLTRQLVAATGRARLDVRDRDLLTWLATLASALTVRYPDTLVAVTCSGVLPRVRFDSVQLELALDALTRNAAEAGAHSVEITARGVDVDATLLSRLRPAGVPRLGTHVGLYVRDDGPGMDVTIRERAFDPFFTTKGFGRGLGLAALLGVIGGHGGGVTIEAGPGGGVIVALYLPATDGAAAEPASAPAGSRPGERRARGRVLVVDDESAVRQVVARGLNHRGFTVVQAPDGPEAIRILEALDGDVAALVLDVSMPQMTGPELFERVRARWRRPALFMSGYAADDVMASLLADPGVDFVAKPFRVDDLAVRLGQLIDRTTPASGR